MLVVLKKRVWQVVLLLAMVLGVCYANSQADEYYKMAKSYDENKDYAKALQYYQKAADMGETRAYFDLGLMYFNGNGVAKDYSKALQYFQKGAKMENASSYGMLGIMYENGMGVEQDGKVAHHYYQKFCQIARNKEVCQKAETLSKILSNAPQNHNVDAYLKAAKFYFEKAEDYDDKGMENLPENRKDFRKLTDEQSKKYKDMSDSYYGMADSYYQAAKEYYKKAAKMGSAKAYTALGHLYCEHDFYDNQSPDNQNIFRDDQDTDGKNTSALPKILEYYEKAAKMGDAGAYTALGGLYRSAECATATGVFLKGASEAKAEEYYKKACRLGDKRGCELLKQTQGKEN
ncbi:hypothetical protein HHE06_01320 [Helicobacter heilmannii]|uniref:SEL1-like repeat protein n=1 Tax=Helicobacter heilmannii TaxID=35817 RepID=UPI0006A1BBCB|nr:tetratricopeptide repeat protein [Helicobacter heilmannii]CRF50309.1 hypothetical protein HHE06_01320 [Helicobacter heilmannii]